MSIFPINFYGDIMPNGSNRQKFYPSFNQKSPIIGINTILLILNNQVALSLNIFAGHLSLAGYFKTSRSIVGKKPQI